MAPISVTLLFWEQTLIGLFEPVRLSRVAFFCAAVACLVDHESAWTQPPPAPTPPPRNIHYHNPELTVQTYSFICGGIERRLTIGFDQARRPLFFSGSRGGDEIHPASVALATTTLRRFDGLGYIAPQCNPVQDRITIEGVLDGNRVDLYIDWEGDRLSLVGPIITSRQSSP